VRVRTEAGQITDVVDIRQPIGIDMEYDVLKGGYVLLPYFHFYNEAGILAFEASDHDPTWRRRPRPAGRWVSTAWIPGNLLSEGTLLIWPCLFTLDPVTVEISVRDAVAFQVVDSMDGDSARGDWGGPITSVMRPLLKWTTQCSVDGDPAVATMNAKAKL
jgi:lipopolysaccharide transport system ATP-binding protein